MKTICFYFQIHQPFRLRRYRFFDIGNNHYYYDDFQNEEIFHRISEKCYLPANRAIMAAGNSRLPSPSPVLPSSRWRSMPRR